MPEVARAAMEAARKHGTVVSFDCNYRSSMWKERGGREAASRVNRDLLPLVDVLFGHEGDLTAAGDGQVANRESFAAMASRVAVIAPGLKVLATTMRTTHSASCNDWSAFAFAQGQVHATPAMKDLDILDRVGAGDAFASGLIFGLLDGKDLEWALRCGVAHGALVMTTPGDNSFATLDDVKQCMAGAGASVRR
jgi:2-dehydro-3-deoxygluconokinase